MTILRGSKYIKHFTPLLVLNLKFNGYCDSVTIPLTRAPHEGQGPKLIVLTKNVLGPGKWGSPLGITRGELTVSYSKLADISRISRGLYRWKAVLNRQMFSYCT